MLTHRIQVSSGNRPFASAIKSGLLALAGVASLAGCEQPTGNPPSGSISIPRKGSTTAATDKAEKGGAEKGAEKPAAK